MKSIDLVKEIYNTHVFPWFVEDYHQQDSETWNNLVKEKGYHRVKHHCDTTSVKYGKGPLTEVETTILYHTYHAYLHYCTHIDLLQKCEGKSVDIQQHLKHPVYFFDFGCGTGACGLSLYTYMRFNKINTKIFYYGYDINIVHINYGEDIFKKVSLTNVDSNYFANISDVYNSIISLNYPDKKLAIINFSYIFAHEIDYSVVWDFIEKILAQNFTNCLVLIQDSGWKGLQNNNKYNQLIERLAKEGKFKRLSKYSYKCKIPIYDYINTRELPGFEYYCNILYK